MPRPCIGGLRRFASAVYRPKAPRALAAAAATVPPPPSAPLAAPAPAAADDGSEYQRLAPREHVLVRPGMYVGSTEAARADAWTLDATGTRMVRGGVSFVPGLLKIFDEILVNACDNKQRDPRGMTALDVAVGAGDGSIPPRVRVRNDGRGLPVVIHAREGLYVPELVFGHLLTGSNFGGPPPSSKSAAPAASAAATTGGRHGYGAKLTNIFSTRFAVQTVDGARGLAFAQEWTQNMSVAGKPRITPLPVPKASASGGVIAHDMTSVEFEPDMSRFASSSSTGSPADATVTPKGLTMAATRVDEGTLALMRRRVVDAAGTLGLAASGDGIVGGGSLPIPVRVTLDGVDVRVTSWRDYCLLYTPAMNPDSPPSTTTPATTGSPAPLPSIASLAAGFSLPSARARLGALQCATLSPRLEVAAGVAGLRINTHSTTDAATGGSGGEEGDVGSDAAAAEEQLLALSAYNAPGAFASFVNCMATPRAGSHVTVVTDVLARRLAEYCNKRIKRIATAAAAEAASASSGSGGARGATPPSFGGGAASPAALASALASATVTPALVRAHLRVAVNVRLESPSFDSQSKEALVSPHEVVLAELLRFASGGGGKGGVGDGTGCLDAAEEAALLLPDAFVRSVAVEGGVLEGVMSALLARASADLSRTVRRSVRSSSDAKVRSIPKLEDANWAGGKRAAECRLILTEGDSAKALAVAGLGVVGRDSFGVFPLRGKLLNVRDAPLKDALENAEVAALIAILGLDLGKTYAGLSPSERGLRYGRVCIMADQDVDGSHIKGLVLNFFHTYWPRLLEGPEPFLEAFMTPLVKARSSDGRVRSFFSLPEFNAWRRGDAAPADARSGVGGGRVAGEALTGKWATKYYKGLGTSTSAEGRSYFSAIAAHTAPFSWGGQGDGDALTMAFSRDRAEDRKAWLSASAAAAAAAAVKGAAASGSALLQPSAVTAAPPTTTFTSFVNDELIHFSRADLSRSIPSVLDGLKPSQRKVLFACFKRIAGGGRGSRSVSTPSAAAAAIEEDEDSLEGAGDGASDGADVAVSTPSTKGAGLSLSSRLSASPPALRDTEVKVAQLAGYVAEHSAYHHGEASLVSTIVSMAQDFTGSNNIPLLQPLGQFGTRLAGGKDAASARYIYTRLAPITRLLFPSSDDVLLTRNEDDGALVEPLAYLPVVPLILINGAQGIGTGWSTLIPPHDPIAVCDAVDAALQRGWLDTCVARERARGGGSDGDMMVVGGERPLPGPEPFPLLPWWRGFKGRTEPVMRAEGGGREQGIDGVVTWGCADWDIPAPTAASLAARPSPSGTSSDARTPLLMNVSATHRRRGAVAAPAPSRPSSSSSSSGSGSSSSGSIAGGDYLDGMLLGGIEGEASGSGAPTLSVRITELPVGRWIDDYKAFLHTLVARGVAKSISEFHTEARAEFRVLLTPAGAAEVRTAADAAAVAVGGSGHKPVRRRRVGSSGSGDDCGGIAAPLPSAAAWRHGLGSFFRLSAPLSLRNQHLFDARGAIVRYTTPWAILADFLPLRGAAYAARHERTMLELEGASVRAAAKARFLSEVVSGQLDVSKRSRHELASMLWERGYPAAREGASEVGHTTPLPLPAWTASATPDAMRILNTDMPPVWVSCGSSGAPPRSRGAFDYLVSLPLWSLTADSVGRSAAAAADAAAALARVRETTPTRLWQDDLAALRAALQAQRDEEGGGDVAVTPAASVKVAVSAAGKRKRAVM